MSSEDVRIKQKETKNRKIENINKKELDTFDEMMEIIDIEKPSEERILDLLIKAKNPYAFLVDGTIVKINYASRSGADKLDDILPKVIANEYMNRGKKTHT